MTNDFFKRDALGNDYAGDHILLDIYDGNALYDEKFLQRTIEMAARLAGAEIIESKYHSFGSGKGVSGMTLLSESHISVHTWPERGFAAFDIFMCGKALPEKAAQFIISELMPSKYTIRREKRGEDADHKTWGQHLVLDLGRCDKKRIGSSSNIKEWCAELVRRIDMEPYGNPIIEHFGHEHHETEGFTLIQLIETSSITAHFAENIGQAYIDVFSCKPFSESEVKWVCQKWFKPKSIKIKSMERGQS